MPSFSSRSAFTGPTPFNTVVGASSAAGPGKLAFRSCEEAEGRRNNPLSFLLVLGDGDEGVLAVRLGLEAFAGFFIIVFHFGLAPFAHSSVQDDLGLRVLSEVPDEVLVESGLGARDDDQVADQARLEPRSAAPQIASSSRAPPAAAMTGPSSETGDGIGVAIVRVRW